MCAGLQLIGPVAAPVIGGALSSSLSWRATFVFLAAFSACLGALLYTFLPETHQYYTLKQLANRDPAHLASVLEAAGILAAEPVFQPPWAVLQYLYAPAFAPYVLLNAWAHASLFACLTLWPLFVVAPPYELNEALVGVTFLANGVRSLTGSFVGRYLADRAAKRFAQAPEGRMVYNLAITALSMPLGMLLLGWGVHAHMHIAVLLLASYFVGFGISSLVPGVYSYVSCVDQASAGSATAAVNAAWCMLSGLMVLVSVSGVNRLGFGGYLTLLAGVHVLLVAVAGACIFWRSWYSHQANCHAHCAVPSVTPSLHDVMQASMPCTGCHDHLPPGIRGLLR